MLKKYILLLTTVIFLTACGDNKKIDIGANSATEATTGESKNTPTPNAQITLNPDYVEAFGESLAAFHNIHWEETIEAAKDDGQKYTISINGSSSVANQYVDSVYQYDTIIFESATNQDVLKKLFGDTPIYYFDDEHYPRIKLQEYIDYSREEIKHYQNELDHPESIESWELEIIKENLANAQENLAHFEEMLANLPEEGTAEDIVATDFSKDHYFCYTEDGKGIIDIGFSPNFSDIENNYLTKCKSLWIDNYPMPESTSDIATDKAVAILNSLLEKLDILPITEDDLTDKVYTHLTKPDGTEQPFADFYFEVSIPGYEDKLYFSTPKYYITFWDGWVTLNISMPLTSNIHTVEHTPLLSYGEINNIVKEYLPKAINEYYKLSKHDKFYVVKRSLELVNDWESKAFVPAWRIIASTYEYDYNSVEILRVNAIDGTILDILERPPYNPIMD